MSRISHFAESRSPFRAVLLAACTSNRSRRDATARRRAVRSAAAAATGGPLTPDPGGKIITVELYTDAEGNYFKPAEIHAQPRRRRALHAQGRRAQRAFPRGLERRALRIPTDAERLPATARTNVRPGGEDARRELLLSVRSARLTRDEGPPDRGMTARVPSRQGITRARHGRGGKDQG